MTDRQPSRNLLAAAAVGIHLCIGSVYAYSVWKAPLEQSTGWSAGQIALAFSLAILFLGLSAGFLGGFIDSLGPRRSCLLASVLFGGGLLGSAAATRAAWLPGYYLGYGVIGGIGLGIGYVAPVSMLVRWFPDRRGLATGLATMGFGFGALLAGPWISRELPLRGVPGTFALLGGVYLVLMLICALPLRNPPEDWASRFSKPANKRHTPEPEERPVCAILRSPAYLSLWGMFFLNICCGIALISIAAPMAQEQAGLTPAAAAAMVGLMGLFNGLGRIGWSTASDHLGRGRVWLLFYLLQIAAFLLMPRIPSALAFQALVFLILTCYGGGFATAPAFLGDLFGTARLSTLYGVLLTAWSAAGLAGPLLAATLRERTGGYAGVPDVFAALLLLGLLLQYARFRCAKT